MNFSKNMNFLKIFSYSGAPTPIFFSLSDKALDFFLQKTYNEGVTRASCCLLCAFGWGDNRKEGFPFMPRRNIRLSTISMLHYFKLIWRSGLLITATVLYILNRVGLEHMPFGDIQNKNVVFYIIWILFAIGMILRFFPSNYESMGCQKQFAKNFIPTEVKTVKPAPARSTFAVAAAWLALNGAIGALYYTGLIDEGILLLIALFYSVCDMICILFFCPFQTWFMKNKCCGSCRIYNWDYAMMFTPFVFLRDVYTWSLLGIALLLLLFWEISIRLHPERFSEKTNACLSCSHCKEKLCHHKKQLQHFLKVNKFTRK